MNINPPSVLANAAAVGNGVALTGGTFTGFLNPGPDVKPPYGPIAWASVNIFGTGLQTTGGTATWQVSTDGSTFVSVGVAAPLTGSATNVTGLAVIPVGALLTHPTTGVAVTHVRVVTACTGTIAGCSVVARTDYV